MPLRNCSSTLILTAAFAVLTLGPTLAEDPNEDDRRVCPLVSYELAQKASEASKGEGRCKVSCKGCGCKGGPGYRGPKGCVGWANLISVCGPSPHSTCQRECAIVEPGCRGRAWLKSIATSAGLALSFIAADPSNSTVRPTQKTRGAEVGGGQVEPASPPSQ